ncbi:MAG: hypothetical protein P8Y99_13370 [Calditrichaceae bacterium]
MCNLKWILAFGNVTFRLSVNMQEGEEFYHGFDTCLYGIQTRFIKYGKSS